MSQFKKLWWKVLCVVLLVYTIIAGFLVPSPALPILHESIRNLYFHVPMWFGMTILLFISVYYSIRYLGSNNLTHDIYAAESARIGLLMGTLGIVTGMQWARTTWGAWWTNDPKLMGAAVGLLIYLAYFVLRNSLSDMDKSARISAVYNVFAFAMLFPTIWIIPRLVESLHPGGMGNPALDTKDIDSRMRLVFWFGAVPGWTLLGVWISTLHIRLHLFSLNQDRHV